jgi:hypothetical protein
MMRMVPPYAGVSSSIHGTATMAGRFEEEEYA